MWHFSFTMNNQSEIVSGYFYAPGEVIPDNLSRDNILAKINYLINHDFEKLIFILYRIDVNEGKIKNALGQINAEGAAEIILKLIEEREAEKATSREKFRNRNDPPAGDW